MSGIIDSFGRYITRTASAGPDRARRLILAAYRANGLAIRVAPERRLSPGRRYGTNYINDCVVRMLAHPEQAALVSVFMPCELLQVMDIVPMCAEMYSSYINGTKCESVFADEAQDRGIAETFCSYHKVLLGSAYAGVLPKPSMVANCSLICDANQLTFRELARHYQVPHYYIDVPPERCEENVHYVADQFRELAKILEDRYGRKLEKDALKAAVARSAETIQIFRECIEAKRTHFQPASIVSELNEIYMTHNALGTKEAQKYAAQLLKDLQHAPAPKGIRLLWLYAIPIWQSPVKELLDFNDRCQLTACDMNLDCLVDLDPEQPYESMARRLVYSCFNGGIRRVEDAVRNARALDVDGVVCFCNWGCKQAMGISSILKKGLEAEGFPTLILNGDACDRRNASDGQTATRLNAFVEMLEKRK